jgi:hypothetical protein
MRRSGDFPKDIIIAARNNTIIHDCIGEYLTDALTEYEALTKMVVLLAKENEKQKQLLIGVNSGN